MCGACETFEIELLSEVSRIPEEQQKVTTFLDNSFTTRFVRYGHVSDKTRDGVDSRFYTFANWAAPPLISAHTALLKFRKTRAGSSVFHNNKNPEIERWVASFGFESKLNVSMPYLRALSDRNNRDESSDSVCE